MLFTQTSEKLRALRLEADDVYVMGGMLGVGDLMQLYGLDRPDLRDKPLRMTVPAPLSKKKQTP